MLQKFYNFYCGAGHNLYIFKVTCCMRFSKILSCSTFNCSCGKRL